MSRWSQPSDPQELRELARQTSAVGSFSRRWYALAFTAGVALVAVLGFSTDLFDSGPTQMDVNAAYWDGFEEGRSLADAAWAVELEEIWWEEYARGQAEGSSLAPAIAEAMRDGFSWEGGFETGLKSPDIDVEQRYVEGWRQGFVRGWTQVTGVDIHDLPAPDLPDWRAGGDVQGIERESEP